LSALVCPEEVKSFALDRVRTCSKTGAGAGPYSFRPGGAEALAASCDAALVLHVCDLLPDDVRLRQQWVDYLNAFQDPQTAWYVSDDASAAYAGEGRMPAWLFGMVIRALNALGGRPRFPLAFLDEWRNPEALHQWMRAGKDIMHLGILWLRYLERAAGQTSWTKYFFQLLDGEEPWCVPTHPRHRKNWEQVCRHRGQNLRLPPRIARDPFHTLFVYYAANRKPPHAEEIIDWFLLEQDETGFLINPAPYSHMDGLSILVSLSQRTGYRRDDVASAARRALDWVLAAERFHALWDVDLHMLLARCETIAVGLQVLTEHPFAAAAWRSAWDLDLWRVQ